MRNMPVVLETTTTVVVDVVVFVMERINNGR